MVTDALCVGLKPFVSSTVRIECPTPPDSVSYGPYGMIEGNEWFADKSSSFYVDLEKAAKFVDEQINDMRYRYNIDTEDIVLVGLSEGGMLALYTAISARYKL